MNLITNSSIDKQQFADGFNQGMQKAAETQSTMLQLLVLSFGIKILIDFPPVKKRMQKAIGAENLEAVKVGADVLAFFITVMIYWTYLGNPLIG